ncbi:MAG: envZ [Burkholderia sp.]|nr:envZ [Burkholderia sp.]
MYSFLKGSRADRLAFAFIRIPYRKLMPISRNRQSWLMSGLFWRTFLLLAVLITASMAAWVVSFRVV